MGTTAGAGTVIEGKYRLERELGSGGMGSVWLATQLMVDRPVAVKVLHPSHIDQSDLQARFEVEAKAIGRLNHPNVITLYDFGFSETLDAFYTVIEFIDGASLDQKLDQRLPLQEITAIIRQIAHALDHAHHYGILHRDLKPENVMLAKMTDGTEIVKVLDFGIARMVKGGTEPDTQESHRITKAGEVFGTPAYMSPEQARSIRQLTPSADLYSLGVIFYELIAGGLPFFAQSAFDLLMMHVTKPVPPIRRLDVPEELCAVIYRLLDKTPENRFQSGRELVQALDALVLPEHVEDSAGEFEAGPTLEANTPTPTIGTPPPRAQRPVSSGPVAVAAMQQMAGAAASDTSPPALQGDRSGEFFAGAHASHSPPSGEFRQPTMMLDSDGREFSTGSFEDVGSRRGLVGIAIGMLAFCALVAVIIWVAFVDTNATGAAAADTVSPSVSAPSNVTAEANGTENGTGEKASDEETTDDAADNNDDKDVATIELPKTAHVVPELPSKATRNTDKKAAEAPDEDASAQPKKTRDRPTRQRTTTRKKKKKQSKPVFERMTLDEGKPAIERQRL